jgi:hypothetical protein
MALRIKWRELTLLQKNETLFGKADKQIVSNNDVLS